MKIGVRSLMFCLLGGTGCWSRYFSLEKELIIKFTFVGVFLYTTQMTSLVASTICYKVFLIGQGLRLCFLEIFLIGQGLRLGPFKIHDPQCAR